MDKRGYAVFLAEDGTVLQELVRNAYSSYEVPTPSFSCTSRDTGLFLGGAGKDALRPAIE